MAYTADGSTTAENCRPQHCINTTPHKNKWKAITRNDRVAVIVLVLVVVRVRVREHETHEARDRGRPVTTPRPPDLGREGIIQTLRGSTSRATDAAQALLSPLYTLGVSAAYSRRFARIAPHAWDSRPARSRRPRGRKKRTTIFQGSRLHGRSLRGHVTPLNPGAQDALSPRTGNPVTPSPCGPRVHAASNLLFSVPGALSGTGRVSCGVGRWGETAIAR